MLQSLFIGGFESSSHRLYSGKRLDLLAATHHTRYADVKADYVRLAGQNITTVRESIRWHLIETKPYHYSFVSVLPAIRAAHATGTQVIWDLFHYGWPDDLDIFSGEFVTRFGKLVQAFVSVLSSETDTTPILAPVNEISFMAWGGGDAGCINPFARGRGGELKKQLVRATIAAIDASWMAAPHARIAQIDPIIHIAPRPGCPEDEALVAGYLAAQYEAWDMIAGRLCPELGGQEKYLDLLGVNYYANNQWFHEGRPIRRHEPEYRPLRAMLAEVYARYSRPLFIGETGAEDWVRTNWLSYVCSEVRAARKAGVPVQGVCLYPVLDYPGWDDERHCRTGLWGYPDERGARPLYAPLAQELQRQQRLHATEPVQPADHRRTAPPAKSKGSDTDGWHPLPAICLFTDSLEPSGVGEHMLTLAGQLLVAHPIVFVCPPTEKGRNVLARAQQLGCETLALEVRGDGGPQAKAAVTALVKHLRARAVQIFHCHAGIGWEGHAGVYAARAAGVPAVVRTEHLPYLLTNPDERRAYHQALRVVDRVICVSQEARSTYVAAGVPPSKLRVVRNGILAVTPVPDRAGVRARLGLAPEAKIVLTVARLTEQKGHTHLLAAIPAVLAAAPEAHFLWVGEGPLAAALHQQMAQLGVPASRLIFAGRRSDVPDLLAACDLFVLPSVFEGLPLVVLEALANGAPVVGTRVCGTSEAIQDGITGRLVPACDSAALAAAVIEALTQPALVAQWRQAGLARSVEEFSARRMAAEIVAVYATLAARPAAPGHHRGRQAAVAAGSGRIPRAAHRQEAQRGAAQD